MGCGISNPVSTNITTAELSFDVNSLEYHFFEGHPIKILPPVVIARASRVIGPTKSIYRGKKIIYYRKDSCDSYEIGKKIGNINWKQTQKQGERLSARFCWNVSTAVRKINMKIDLVMLQWIDEITSFIVDGLPPNNPHCLMNFFADFKVKSVHKFSNSRTHV